MFAGIYGLNKDTARRAFNTLVEYGYIVECGKNQYSFYETPQKKVEFELPFEEEKLLIKQKGDTWVEYTKGKFYEEMRQNGHADDYIEKVWDYYKSHQGE